MRPLGSTLRRARDRIRNGIGGVFLRARAMTADPHDSPPPASSLRHYPCLPVEQHPPGHRFPDWMDTRVPWIGALAELYARAISWPASISPQAGLLLYGLVVNARPRTIIETGTFAGISTIWMAAALRSVADRDNERRIHCFDYFDAVPWVDSGALRAAGVPDQRAMVTAALDRAGLGDLVELHPGDSSKQLGKCEGMLSGRGVQLAFIDGDHTEAGATRDFRAAERVLDTGGYVVLHDIFPDQCGHRGPRYLIDHLRVIARGRYQVCELCTAPLNYGMAVLRRIG